MKNIEALIHDIDKEFTFSKKLDKKVGLVKKDTKKISENKMKALLIKDLKDKISETRLISRDSLKMMEKATRINESLSSNKNIPKWVIDVSIPSSFKDDVGMIFPDGSNPHEITFVPRFLKETTKKHDELSQIHLVMDLSKKDIFKPCVTTSRVIDNITWSADNCAETPEMIIDVPIPPRCFFPENIGKVHAMECNDKFVLKNVSFSYGDVYMASKLFIKNIKKNLGLYLNSLKIENGAKEFIAGK